MGAMTLRTPIVNALIRDLSMARFGRLFGTLLGSGVGVLPALGIARAAAAQPQLEDALQSAEAATRRAELLSCLLYTSAAAHEPPCATLRGA